MKVAHAVLLSVLFALPVAAQSQPGDFGPIGEPTSAPSSFDSVSAHLDQQVADALNQMEREARARGVSRETFNRAAQALQARADFGRETLGEAAEVWDALAEAVRRLETQARSVMNDLAETHAIQMAVIERHLDTAIEDLRDAALLRGVSRELFDRHVALLTARAAAADNFGPVARNIHNRLSAQVEMLLDRAQSGSASVELFQQVRLAMVRERLNEALVRLEEAAVLRGATREDYERVAQAYEALARAQAEEIQSLGY